MRTWVLLLIIIGPSMGNATDVPFLAGRVNDTAGMLSGATITQLEQLLKAHEDSTSNQVVVLTVPDLGGESIEEFSIKVAETWALGQADKDNGVLLLVARDDRQVRIEVGMGLEGDLTDATSGRIIRNEIVPRFKDGEFDEGVRRGTEAILAAIHGSYASGDDSLADEELIGRLVAGAIFLVVVGLFSIIAVVSAGFISWFLFVFLLPFWISFPNWILGPTYGMVPAVIYVAGFIIMKIWLSKTGRAAKLAKSWGMSGGTSGGWSSRSGSFSSGGSSFSGGGGSFSGGGSSGSW
jgi:uncharacterized protein